MLKFKGSFLLPAILVLCQFNTSYALADVKTADEYYNECRQYPYSQPYAALDLALEAINIYPSDIRFKEEIATRSDTIVTWSSGSQNNNHFDAAIYGYTKLKDITILPNYMKSYILRQLDLAQNSKPSTTKEEYYSLEGNYGYSDPYNALAVLNEANYAFKDSKLINDLNERCNTILSWSIGSQNKGNFDAAIYGYKTILDSINVRDDIRHEAEKYLSYAVQGKKYISSDEYYNLAKSYSYSLPYDALKVLVEANQAYPQDSRFTQLIKERTSVILSWSEGSHRKNNFDAAIYGYNTIINTPTVDNNVINYANSQMARAKNMLQPISLDEYITLASQNVPSNPYYALNICLEALVRYQDSYSLNQQIAKSTEVICNWSYGSHSNNSFDAAIYGYNVVLNSPAPKNIKDFASRQKQRAIDKLKPFTADDYVKLLSQYTSSQPYDILAICNEATLIYSNNASILTSLNNAASTILNWSFGTHSKGNFDSAAYGYITILNSSYVDKAITDMAAKYLGYASSGKLIYVSAQDYYSKIHSLSVEQSKEALSLLNDALSFFPNDKSLNDENQVRAAEVLRQSREEHKKGNFDNAIAGYNAILFSSAPRPIFYEARVCKLIASQKQYVLDNYTYKPEFAAIAEKAWQDYKTFKFTYPENINYNTFGSYLDWEDVQRYTVSDYFKYDSSGIPMVKYGTEFYYNPVTVSQYALTEYGKYLRGEDTLSSFLKCADFLISNMSSDGSFRYSFTYYHYQEFKPGWTSSMSQGHALSVFARAYNVTKDPKYLTAGNKVLKYLLTPVSEGGVLDDLTALNPSWKYYIFFQEYVVSPSSYTLNGYIFTLLGLYDWSQVSPGVNTEQGLLAKQYFDWGITSLKLLLPYYDIGCTTSYDLYYLSKNTTPTPTDYYHSVHIYELQAIYSITKDKFFNDVRDLWISYVK